MRGLARKPLSEPVIGRDHSGRLQALHWLAAQPGAANLGIVKLERAQDVDSALALAPTIGIPPQNFMVADRAGNIGWTIIGRVPVRRGYDARFPASWASGSSGWRGWLPPEHYPRVVNPPSEYLAFNEAGHNPLSLIG